MYLDFVDIVDGMVELHRLVCRCCGPPLCLTGGGGAGTLGSLCLGGGGGSRRLGSL